MYLDNLQRLVEAIEQKSTGNAREIAKKLNVSERMVYNYLDVLKNEFGAPIKFNRSTQSYYFTEAGSLDLSWKDEELNNSITQKWDLKKFNVRLKNRGWWNKKNLYKTF